MNLHFPRELSSFLDEQMDIKSLFQKVIFYNVKLITQCVQTGADIQISCEGSAITMTHACNSSV